MKILHLVALITPDGSYGGPQRVSCSLSSILRQRGHDVMLVAGHRGFSRPPKEVDRVAATLFPTRRILPGFGYAATVAPAMPAWLWRHAREFDIAHVHLSRDLVTLPATTLLRRAGVPYVVQTHGMVTPDSHPLAAPIDRLRTAKLLREASCVLELNDEERQSLRRVAGDGLRFRRLRNGVPVGDGSNPRRSRSAVPEVLFLARLHERKRPQLFAEAGLMLLQQGVRARFAVVGPAEGAEAGVDSVLEVARREGFTEEQIRREAGVPPESVADRMAKASVYVLPASHEPFGLTIIEALAQGVPVVTCADGGLASFIRRHRCGLIADVTAASFAAAIGQLLENPAMAADFGDRGRQAVRSEFSLDDVGKDLEDIYSSVLGTQIS